LFGAAFLGPRLGRFGSKFEDSQELAGHSVPVSVKKIYICVFSGEVHGTEAKQGSRTIWSDRENLVYRVRESFGTDRENLVYIILN